MFRFAKLSAAVALVSAALSVHSFGAPGIVSTAGSSLFAIVPEPATIAAMISSTLFGSLFLVSRGRK